MPFTQKRTCRSSADLPFAFTLAAVAITIVVTTNSLAVFPNFRRFAGQISYI
jgi:hypothetical protein